MPDPQQLPGQLWCSWILPPVQLWVFESEMLQSVWAPVQAYTSENLIIPVTAFSRGRIAASDLHHQRCLHCQGFQQLLHRRQAWAVQEMKVLTWALACGLAASKVSEACIKSRLRRVWKPAAKSWFSFTQGSDQFFTMNILEVILCSCLLLLAAVLPGSLFVLKSAACGSLACTGRVDSKKDILTSSKILLSMLADFTKLYLSTWSSQAPHAQLVTLSSLVYYPREIPFVILCRRNGRKWINGSLTTVKMS